MSRKITQKQDFTFLEMRDFCDNNQQFIHIQPDIMGRKRVSVRKYDTISGQHNKSLLSLTYDGQAENRYYDLEDTIVTINDNQDMDTEQTDFFNQVDNMWPLEPLTKDIAAITRSNNRSKQVPVDIAQSPEPATVAQHLQSQAPENIQPISVIDKNSIKHPNTSYQPVPKSSQKIKKQKKANNLNLELIKNQDILKSVSENKGDLKVIGFAAETQNIIENAKF